MTSKLPATQDATLAIPGVQSSLFGSPLELLEVDDAELRRVAALVGHEAGSVLVQVRRFAGLVAWAAWYRMDEKGYREFASGLASDLGIEVETLRKWRRAVVTKEKLPVPGMAGQRAEAAAKGRITAGQTAGAVRTSATAAPIPVPSTEAPAKSSEGVAPASETVPEPTRGTLSDQSSGGAELQPPTGPTGEAPTSPRSAPPGPTEKITASHTDTDWSKVAPTTTERPPSDRQLAARVVSAMQNVDPTDAGPALTPEEATFLRQWAQRTLDAWKAVYAPPAPAEKPQRRQGTITRPADRIKGPRPYDPVTLTIPVPTSGRKGHADDCSCLSCKAPKAVVR